MALPLEQFVQQLEDSGIIASETLKDFIPPKANPKNSEELARELVVKKKLTKFQASEAYQGKAKSLRLGNYTILDKIGAGGMGQVFKAEHRRMHRIVAIKMLPPALTKDAAALARFEREVTAAAKLEHPNIVAAYDADEARGVHFLVMQYVEGRDLSALVKKDGPFPVDKAVNYVLQAARGLEFAHKNGVIHRDIKPANLLLGTDGTVKILDMGLARIEAVGDADAQAELTGTGMVMGTVDYMAPEQGMNTKNADARADIYSLGCTLHYLLIGKPVYRGETVMAKMVAHLQEPIPNLCQLRNEVPLQVDTVFQKMVAKKIGDRYQTMTEVVADLEQCGVGRDVSMSGQHSLGLDADEGLLTFLKDIPAGTTHKTKATKAAKATGQGGSKIKKPLLIGAGVLGVVVLLLGVIFMFRTKDGTLVVEVNQPGAIVQVLSEEGKVEISEPGGLQPISISVVPGKHRIRVEKDGFVAIANDIEVASGGTLDIKARLVPKAGKGPGASGQGLVKAWETPVFQQWVKATQTLPAEKQVEAVSKKLMELNPGFVGKLTGWGGKGTPKIEQGVITELGFLTDHVTDISPLRALIGLEILSCFGSISRKGALSNLSPLQGMKLTYVGCFDTQVSDLSPLQGMKLTSLQCGSTQISNLSPLQGMPLSHLSCGNTQVSNLSPLQGMPLVNLYCGSTKISDLSPLEACRSLKSLNVNGTKTTPAAVAALQKALPNCKIEWDGAEKGLGASGQGSAKPWETPEFQQWVKATQALSADKQIEAVSKKLMELNPGFVGKMAGRAQRGTPKIEQGVVTELGFLTNNVADISPVRALAGLKLLHCDGNNGVNSELSDLSPLDGMQLTSLGCSQSQVSDLTPLKGMPLTSLSCHVTRVADLSPLQGMPLSDLNISNLAVSDLSPLRGMKLTLLNCGATKITDISILKGMPLAVLFCYQTQVSDLSPLEDCKSLKTLKVNYAKVTAAQVAALQQALPNCKIEWDGADKGPGASGQGLVRTWETPEFQAWVNATQALPAEKQIEAVSKKLMELNPGFDGVVANWDGKGTPKITSGFVTWFGFVTDNVTDISPVRALAGLQKLRCHGSSGRHGMLSDLSPLQGMPLISLNCGSTQVSDLSPLQGTNLQDLTCNSTPVSDLSPLKGLPLTALFCPDTLVSDLSPLEGMSLAEVMITPKKITHGLDIIRQMKSLKIIRIEWGDNNQFTPAEFWKKYDAGEFGKPGQPAAGGGQPAAKAKLGYLDPAFQQWVKATQALPAEKQIEAVSKKLMELNPGFDGKVTGYAGGVAPKIDQGKVADLGLTDDSLTDISPVRVLTELKNLKCSGRVRGRLSDLSPLAGMKLTYVNCSNTKVSDLAPLHGMQLTQLHCDRTQVSDLAPLKGMPLGSLNIGYTPVADLSPLERLPLLSLTFNDTRVSDLSWLSGMKLMIVACNNNSGISEIASLASCTGLKNLDIRATKVTASSVANVQRALPDCKIVWDGETKK